MSQSRASDSLTSTSPMDAKPSRVVSTVLDLDDRSSEELHAPPWCDTRKCPDAALLRSSCCTAQPTPFTSSRALVSALASSASTTASRAASPTHGGNHSPCKALRQGDRTASARPAPPWRRLRNADEESRSSRSVRRSSPRQARRHAPWRSPAAGPRLYKRSRRPPGAVSLADFARQSAASDAAFPSR
eukprot:scaffold1484_cov241-Pinguiococcus_pyrenoidosus.AAC.6